MGSAEMLREKSVRVKQNNYEADWAAMSPRGLYSGSAASSAQHNSRYTTRYVYLFAVGPSYVQNVLDIERADQVLRQGVQLAAEVQLVNNMSARLRHRE